MRVCLSMITKNEEENLSICLERAKRFVDEIIVVDTGSTDRTKDIARSFGAKVYDFLWIDDFSAARNFALSKSSADWNLVLDADEQIVMWDKNFMDQFLRTSYSIGRIKVVSNFKQNGEEQRSQDFISRLLPKGVFFTGKIHEQISSPLTRVNLPIEVLHTGYFETDKSERNLQLLLSELRGKEQDPYLLYQLGRQYKLMRQTVTANRYFAAALKYINKDEKYSPDLIVNYLYTLIDEKKFLKAFEIMTSESGWLKRSPDFQFVSGIFYLNYVLHDPKHNIGYLQYIENSYLNCLSLNQTGWEEIVIGTSSYLAAYNLAVYYETTGNTLKAIEYYQIAADLNYQPALDRLTQLK